MSEDLGSAHGSITINAAAALATLASLRRSSANTVGALNTTGRAAITGGTAIGAVGAGIAAVFATAVAKSAEIEKKISYIAGIANIHGKEIDVVRNKIIQLGQDSAYTASEVADGFTELTKAGATTAQLVGGVGDAMITLGQSADIGLADAATALVSISSTFNLLPKDAAHIADVLQGAANASIISVDDMAVSFKYAGGVAANLGLSVEDTATAIAILGNAGIRGSTAGTSLRRIFLQLTPRTKDAAAEMEKLGIITKEGGNRFYDAQGKAKKLSEITEILRTSTKNLTPEMKQKALATIFGDRAINSAIALSKGGATAFDKMQKTIGNVKAADIAAQRLNNLAGAWEILKGTIDSALIRAGAPAQKPLIEIVRLVTRLVNAFNSLSPSTQAMIVRFALITGAAFLLVGGFLIIVGTIFRAAAVFLQLVNVLKIVRTQIILFTAVQKAANGALLFSPITLIVVAIIALVLALIYAYKHSERFRAIVDKVASVLKDAAIAVWNFLKRIPEAVSNAWNATTGFFSDLFQAVSDFVTTAIDFVKNNWTSILLVVLLGPLGLVILGFLRFKDRIIGFITSLVQTVGSWFAQLPRLIGFALGFIIGAAIRFQIRIWTILVVGAINLVKAVVSFWAKLPGRIVAILGAIIGFLIAWVPRVIAQGIRVGSQFIQAVISFFSRLPGRVRTFLGNVIRAIIDFATRAVSRALEMGQAFTRAIIDGISGLPGRVAGILGRVIQAFKDVIRRGFDAAKGFASGLWEGFKSGLGVNSPSFIEKQMVQITNVTDKETKTLRGQIRTLRQVGARLPVVDAASSTTNFSGGSLRARDSSFSSAASASSASGVTQNITINNPARRTVMKSYDRALKEAAYVNGYSK